MRAPRRGSPGRESERAVVRRYKAVFTRAEGVRDEMDTWDWIIDILFYFDIVLNFWTAYDTGYRLERGKLKIAKQYLWGGFCNLGFFWVDLAATVQWDLLVYWINPDAKPGVLSMLKILKVLRMLRFGRLIKRMTAQMKVHSGYVEVRPTPAARGRTRCRDR